MTLKRLLDCLEATYFYPNFLPNLDAIRVITVGKICFI